jgi:hypothetical protein
MNAIHIKTRFPKFELSYETVSHKKVSANDSIAVAIPLGRKYFVWFTYEEGGCKGVCYIIGLNKDKQICSVEERKGAPIPRGFSLGTIVYCSFCESNKIYIVEDIYQYSGVNLHNLCFGDRMGFLREFASQTESTTFALPVMWFSSEGSEITHVIPSNLESMIAYAPHHIQYREVRRVAPYVNVAIPKKGAPLASSSVPTSSAEIAQKMYATAITKPCPNFDYSKPAYRHPAVFNIMADSQLDLYHLYAYCGTGSTVYCGLAGVQSFKTSVFMNGIFRRIRENANLDLAEESEDEADFENTDTNKYVDLERIVPIECFFNVKHKKWIPVRLANKSERIIHIDKLTRDGRSRQYHSK